MDVRVLSTAHNSLITSISCKELKSKQNKGPLDFYEEGHELNCLANKKQ